MDARQHTATENEDEVEKQPPDEMRKAPISLGIPDLNQEYRCHPSGDILRNREETHKSAGVVVPDGLGVPEGLQERVGLQDNVLDVLSWQTGQRLGRLQAPSTQREAKLSLRTQIRWGLKSTRSWGFWKIYAFLSTDLNLLVCSRLPTPLTWCLIPWNQGTSRKMGSTDVPGLGFQIGWWSLTLHSQARRESQREGERSRKGHLVATLVASLYWPHPFSTQLLYLPITPPPPPSSLQGERQLRGNEIVSPPRQGCGHIVLGFPNFPVHESPRDLVEMQMQIQAVWGRAWKESAFLTSSLVLLVLPAWNHVLGGKGQHWIVWNNSWPTREEGFGFSNTPLLRQTEKCAKHSTGKTAQQIGVDVGEVFQQVSHSL